MEPQPIIVQPPKRKFNFNFERILDNPVIAKELRGRMRDRRTFILLTFYLSLIAAFVCMIYLFLGESTSGLAFDPDYRQTLGKSIFGTVVLIELLLISFIGPGLTSGALTSEREHRTLDLLKTTLLTPGELVFGKLSSAVIYLFLLIFTVLPIQSLAFILGGVGLAEVVISSLLLVVTSIFFATLGIFFSSFLKRTLAATVSSYGSILLSVFAIIFFVFSMSFITTVMFSNNPNISKLNQDVFTIIMWLVVSTNPILAPIFTEVILIEDQSIFISNTTSLFGTSGMYLLSPWIIYIFTYTVLSLIMLLASIWFVKRPER
ncbi:MAG: ABC transporter permease subunit [Anaerolineales bacterium]|nr:ABC transporter permease subunit [Anaerolineales bacterium]